MKITAALAWWDERPSDLAECIRGMANIADRVVAYDGAYRRYPNGTAVSDPDQYAAIRQTAAEVGLECLILTPDRLWAGQLEKRTYLYNAAAINSDWVVVVDADHIIHADRAAVRAELEQTKFDVIEAPYPVPLNDSRPMIESAATEWHQTNSGLDAPPHRLLFRALPDLRVEKHHWTVSGLKNGKKVWVLQSDSFKSALPATTLVADYEVEHRFLFRTKERVLAGRAFCNDRTMVVEKTGQEDDVPGLPEPVFDYTTLPF